MSIRRNRRAIVAGSAVGLLFASHSYAVQTPYNDTPAAVVANGAYVWDNQFSNLIAAEVGLSGKNPKIVFVSDFCYSGGFLNNLSTDYKFLSGSCGAGSPRFGATTSTGGTIYFYIGAFPNYTDCPAGVWANTGNLASPASVVDSSQIGGTFYDSYAHVQAVYGSLVITDIFIVADGGNPTQSVEIDNTMVNNATYTYETPDSLCKNGGYQNFTSAPGPFKNQGQCVSYFEHQK